MTENPQSEKPVGAPTPKPKVEYPELGMPPSPQIPNPHPGQVPDCEGMLEAMPDPTQSQVPPPAEGKARILIGIPLLAVSYEFFESFLKFWTSIQAGNPDYEVGYHFAYRKPVHMAEEYLVKTAQFNKCTHILFMDDDIFDVTKDDLDKLVAADKDVIGGVMHASKFPHAMCVFRRYDPTKKVIDMPVDDSMYRLYEVPCQCSKCGVPMSHWDAVFCPSCGHQNSNLIQQADLIPFAFTLMKLSVFDKIKTPWFHCTTGYPTDSWFADRLIEAGMTEYGHMGVRLNHNGVTDETKPHYIQMGMLKAKKAKGVVELSPDQMEAHQNLLIGKMKETEERMRAKPPFIQGGELKSGVVGKEDLTLVTK